MAERPPFADGRPQASLASSLRSLSCQAARRRRRSWGLLCRGRSPTRSLAWV